MDVFIGTIIPWPMNWAPQGWALCNGQLLNITQYQALFSLIGIQFGGNGTSNFGLPNLQGRVPVGMGPNYQVGQIGGAETVTLTTAQMPAHIHHMGGAPASTAAGNLAAPTATSVPAQSSVRGTLNYTDNTTQNVNMKPGGETLPSGGNAAHNNMPPFQVLNYIIATEGIYPTRP